MDWTVLAHRYNFSAYTVHPQIQTIYSIVNRVFGSISTRVHPAEPRGSCAYLSLAGTELCVSYIVKAVRKQNALPVKDNLSVCVWIARYECVCLYSFPGVETIFLLKTLRLLPNRLILCEFVRADTLLWKPQCLPSADDKQLKHSTAPLLDWLF